MAVRKETICFVQDDYISVMMGRIFLLVMVCSLDHLICYHIWFNSHCSMATTVPSPFLCPPGCDSFNHHLPVCQRATWFESCKHQLWILESWSMKIQRETESCLKSRTSPVFLCHRRGGARTILANTLIQIRIRDNMICSVQYQTSKALHGSRLHHKRLLPRSQIALEGLSLVFFLLI